MAKTANSKVDLLMLSGDELLTAVTSTSKTGSGKIDWTALSLAGALPTDKLVTLGANVPAAVYTAAVQSVYDAVPSAQHEGTHGYPTLVQGHLGVSVRRVLSRSYAPDFDITGWEQEQAERTAARLAAAAGTARAGGVKKSELKSLVERMLADNPELASNPAVAAMATMAGVDLD